MDATHINPPVVVEVDGSGHGLRALDCRCGHRRATALAGTPHRRVREPQGFLGLPLPVSAVETATSDSSAVLFAARKHLLSDRQPVEVSSAARREAAVGFAFEEASWRGARLDVVHSWQLPAPYGYELLGEEGVRVWETDAECAVAEAIAGWREKYPDVDVCVLVEHAHPVANLVRHGSAADLIVVGGRAHGEFIATVRGSTALDLLHHADCPVAVVHTVADR